MTKRKLERFEECKTFDNLFQFNYFDLLQDFRLKGNWNGNYFKKAGPIVLELGCGKGEYTVNLAIKNPGVNYIGIDSKGARLWRGCRSAIDNQLDNVAFIRTHIEQIEQIFAPGEVSEIWITFPDPQPSKVNKRLTSPRFLNRYHKILAPGSLIHLKTDNVPLFKYTLNVIKSEQHELIFKTDDLYANNTENAASSIQTFYEKIFLGQGLKITYLCFRLNRLAI